MIKIRKARKEDIAGIYSLDSECFEKAYDTLVLRQFLDLYPESFFVAEESTKIIGYGIGGIVSGQTAQSFLISGGVTESKRKKRIAELLAKEILASLRSLGAERVLATVHPGNKESRALCARLGFREKKLEKQYYGPGEDRLLVELIF